MLIFEQLKNNDHRLRILSLAILAGLLILLGGLWYVQVVHQKTYENRLENQATRTVRIPAIRGKIFDRNGVVLAENRPSYNVNLYLEEIRPQFAFQYTNHVIPEFRRAHPNARLTSDIREELSRQARYRAVSNVVHNLSKVLHQPLQIEPKQFSRHYYERVYMPLPVLENLSTRQIALFQENPNTPSALELEVQPLRYYPFGPLAAHVLGFLNRVNQSDLEEERPYNYPLPDYKGMVGIEGAYDSVLSGQPGIKTVLVNSMNYRQAEEVWLETIPGMNLVLTLDVRVQQAAEKALESAGPNTRGAVVVMDPRNGDVLALASAPDFDPNDFIPRISVEKWQTLMDRELRPQVNRAVGDNFLPGSIFKIITALAFLEAGVGDPNALVHSPGYYPLGRRKIRDIAPPGEYNFLRAFKLSSNYYFIHYGLKTGIDRIVEMARQFGMGEATGIPTLQEVPGFLPSPEWKKKERGDVWREGDTANIAIGQGAIDVTPVQMAVVTSALANGGTVFHPRLVARIEPQSPNAPGNPEIFAAGRIRNQLDVSPDTLDWIRRGMKADVQDPDGTGRQARIPNWVVAGKTGTADVQHKPGVRKHTWFVSFAPYENPRYAVVVMVVNGHYGGTTCAPIAREIYKTLQRIDAGSEAQWNRLARVSAPAN